MTILTFYLRDRLGNNHSGTNHVAVMDYTENAIIDGSSGHYDIDFDDLILVLLAEDVRAEGYGLGGNSAQYYADKLWEYVVPTGHDALTFYNLDHFTFTTTIPDQTHMVPFSVSIEARDSNNNLIPNFNAYVAVLSSECDWGNLFGYANARLIVPAFVRFSGGKWTGQMMVRNPSNVVIRILANGIISDSNAFDVS